MKKYMSIIAMIMSLSLSVYADELAPSAEKLKGFISENCKSCHAGAKGRDIKKFGDFFKFGVLERYVDIFDSEASVLYKKIETKEMPKDDFGDNLSDESRAEFLKAIKEWIDAGTPPLQKLNFNDVIDSKEIEKLALQDYEASPERGVRYVSFLAIYNNLKKRGKLSIYEQALSKLVNSVSWNKNIVVPKKVGTNRVLFRINIEDYGWSAQQWDDLTSVYPYNLGKNQTIENLSKKLGAALPIIRGDWFINTVAKPPFYHEFARIPQKQAALEGFLGINVKDNYLAFQVLRAGFVNSGVSQNNRIIERHNTGNGAFWISYDFATSLGVNNILQNPLGPFKISNEVVFAHDGGEIIFNLPNGLQAYMLVNSKGDRIDTGPSQIVSDPNRPDRLVRNGISCMGCHSQGMIYKSDQVLSSRDTLFNQIDSVKKLYGQREKFAAEMSLDKKRFLDALIVAGVTQNSPEVINDVVSDYDSILDSYDFKSEIRTDFDINEKKVRKLLTQSDGGTSGFSNLKTLLSKEKFLVNRQTFEILAQEVPSFYLAILEDTPSQFSATSNVIKCDVRDSQRGFTLGSEVINKKSSVGKVQT